MNKDQEELEALMPEILQALLAAQKNGCLTEAVIAIRMAEKGQPFTVVPINNEEDQENPAPFSKSKALEGHAAVGVGPRNFSMDQLECDPWW